MTRCMLPLAISCLLLCCAPGMRATAQDWEAAAGMLQRATATVRIWEQPAKDETQLAVTVCSGICVREGLVITAALAGSDTPIRLTLAGGKQADAKVAVIDEYSGLALLRAETSPLAPLPLADGLPAVGSEVLTAAAWGLELPLVGRGMVGGVDRQHPSTRFPPLVQCDALAEQTSTGAGLVDRGGRLLGVVVAADREGGRRGWLYAAPVTHVQRLLRVADAQQGDGIVLLKRRRPVVGMVLDQVGELVVVQRITPNGPADKAGIKPGDQVTATDGVAIRSVYQAVLPTMHKQPGDTVVFRTRTAGAVRDATIVLGGGVEVAAAPADFLADVIQPKVRLARDETGAIVASRSRSIAPEVAVGLPLPSERPPAVASAADKITLLEKALQRYQAVIEVQQQQLASEQNKRVEQEALLQSLRSEIQALQQAIGK